MTYEERVKAFAKYPVGSFWRVRNGDTAIIVKHMRRFEEQPLMVMLYAENRTYTYDGEGKYHPVVSVYTPTFTHFKHMDLIKQIAAPKT